jgi:hypothetical protein
MVEKITADDFTVTEKRGPGTAYERWDQYAADRTWEGPEDELLEEYHAKLDRALIERSDPAGVAEAIARKLEPSGEPLLVRTAARWLADQVMVGDGRYPVLRSRHTALSPIRRRTEPGRGA